MQKHEEIISVKIPGQGHHIVKVMVGPLESDEEVVARISRTVGTVFNVLGTKYEVVSSSPFKLKKLSSPDEEGPEKVEPRISEPPKSDRRGPSVVTAPQVGERWKPRDPRRIASFVVLAIEEGHAVTDDGRRIQLARFPRYERVDAASSKAS